MSDRVETEVPPVGEQIHVAGPSRLPPLLAAGLALALVGVTLGIQWLIIGLALAIPMLALWLRGARDEFEKLPPGH